VFWGGADRPFTLPSNAFGFHPVGPEARAEQKRFAAISASPFLSAELRYWPGTRKSAAGFLRRPSLIIVGLIPFLSLAHNLGSQLKRIHKSMSSCKCPSPGAITTLCCLSLNQISTWRNSTSLYSLKRQIVAGLFFRAFHLLAPVPMLDFN
jgi:hypothetical protein